MDKFSHKESFLKEAIEHKLVINWPASKTFELSHNFSRIRLNLLGECTLKLALSFQFAKEYKFNIFIELQINFWYVSDSFKL